jgi:hypothetical protein
MPVNLLKNGGFEAAWSDEGGHRCLVFPADGNPQDKIVDTVFTPPGWLTWFRCQPGAWEPPEVRETWKQNYPYRVRSGEKAILLFTFNSRHDAGFLQQVHVTPGTRLRLAAWAHAWSNHPLPGYEWCDGDSRCSCGVGEQAAFIFEGDAPPPNGDPWSDAVGNVTFSLGLDPAGGTDPFAETVVWGRGAHIYNAYHEAPPVEATARADTVTVFLRSRTKWPFRNNDACWDDVELVAVGGTVPSARPPVGAHKRARGDVKVQSGVPPREPQRSTYVLLPQIEDGVERMDWRVAAAIGCADQMWAVGHLGDGANADSRDREVVAVNPAEWGRDLREWYAAHHLDVEYREVETASPWEMAVMLLPPLDGDIALAQTDRRWARYDFGEHPGASGGTIGRYGCFMTGLAIILRKIYGRDVTPPMLDKLLVAAGAAFVDDNIMMWEGVVPLFPAFDEGIKDSEQHSAGQLRELLQDGWEIILRQASREHFVYLEAVEGNTLRIIDTWDGVRKAKAASDYRGIRAARVRRRAAAARPQASAGERHVYVLLPSLADAVERLQWRIAAAIGASGQMGMIGHSIDEAGGRAGDQEVIAINPGADAARSSNAGYTIIESASPWEAAVRLAPALDGDIALAQTDPRWATADFGEQPGGNGETIGRCGSFLAGLAIALRRVYTRDVTLPALDRLLVTARAAYDEGNLLLWGNAVSLFPAFDDSVKDDRARSAPELERLLRDDWEIVLKQADEGRFAYLEAVEGDALQVIDPRDGTRKTKAAAEYRGIRAAHIKRRRTAASAHPLLIGLHDRRGGEWMAAHLPVQAGGMRGCCLVHQTLQRQPVQVDCQHLADARVTVICRLTWGYADGSGTLPRPEDRDAFVGAVVQTMLAAQGVEYFCVGNEPNNRQEWPGFGRGSEFALTPQYVVEIYNRVWQQVGGRVRIGPPPLDPYFGPGSNNRDWWRYILQHISGADALFLHAKTQTNNPSEVWSRVRFSDEPLTWQYLHLRTVETALAVVPERFRTLPVFVTELNPQCLDRIGGALGWRPDNAGWVREALRYFREESAILAAPVAGVMFYRYESSAGDQSPFGLEDKPAILAAIQEEAGV